MQPNKNNYSNATQTPQPTTQERLTNLENTTSNLLERICKIEHELMFRQLDYYQATHGNNEQVFEGLKAIARQANDNSKDRPEGE